jgi:hypothetical protein
MSLLSTTKLGDSNPKDNLLLAKLDPQDYEALTRDAKVVSLRLRKRLYRQEEPIEYVYFPITCMVSLLVTEGVKATMEMATVGREGVVGASEAHSRARSDGTEHSSDTGHCRAGRRGRIPESNREPARDDGFDASASLCAHTASALWRILQSAT